MGVTAAVVAVGALVGQTESANQQRRLAGQERNRQQSAADAQVKMQRDEAEKARDLEANTILRNRARGGALIKASEAQVKEDQMPIGSSGGGLTVQSGLGQTKAGGGVMAGTKTLLGA